MIFLESSWFSVFFLLQESCLRVTTGGGVYFHLDRQEGKIYEVRKKTKPEGMWFSERNRALEGAETISLLFTQLIKCKIQKNKNKPVGQCPSQWTTVLAPQYFPSGLFYRHTSRAGLEDAWAIPSPGLDNCSTSGTCRLCVWYATDWSEAESRGRGSELHLWRGQN